MKAKTGFTLLFAIATLAGTAQTKKPFIESLQEQNSWVDSVFQKLNRRERIAQLLMVRAHTNLGQAYSDSVGKVIKRQRLGGVVFFQGGPGRQAELTNRYQEVSRTPLLVAMDAEWGVGMRLDSTVSYPYQMTLGAIQDNQLIYEMGRQIARDFKRLGMQVNFAPVMDVNNNPKNPVINYRSFGDNKYKVAEKGAAYMKGLQDEGVLVTLKHFPGHGDTDVDSHHDLPQLNFTRERLDSLEMYPFREVIRQGASGIMVAHMNIPSLDPTPKLPSTLSQPIVTGILRNDLGYKGLIFSDAMDMKGVSKYYKHGEAEVRGLEAGMDVLELAEDSKVAIREIRKAIRRDRLSWDRINASVKKVLAAKYWAGLSEQKNIALENLASDLNGAEARALNEKLADAAVTVLNGDSLIRTFDPAKRTALVAVGADAITLFQKELQGHFTNSLPFLVRKNADPADLQNMLKELAGYDQVIVGVFDQRKRPGSVLDFSQDVRLLIPQLAGMNSIVSVFANPYTIAGLPGIEKAGTLLVNYQNSEDLQRSASKVIRGTLKPTGKLPVTINSF
ncbi:MAG TPA: glycoside hydrolase family 3 N-terminal domain-containing protein, partial [Sphingobacteriaceae bacterium]